MRTVYLIGLLLVPALLASLASAAQACVQNYQCIPLDSLTAKQKLAAVWCTEHATLRQNAT